jgi:azurin
MITTTTLLSIVLWALQPQTITITADDLMRFAPNQISIQAGAEVTLVLHNKGRIGSLKHNFVLVKSEADIEKLGNLAASKGGEIPVEHRTLALAASDLTGPGQKTQVSLKITEKGTYYFFSSYPGSSAIMRGKLIVK